MKKKRTVTINFDRVKITASHRRQNLFCPVCRAKSVFLNEAEAIGLLRFLQTQGVFVGPNDLHFCQSDADRTLVCLNSIINSGSKV